MATIPLEQQIEDLRAEVEYWKAEARATASVRQVDALRNRFGMTCSEAWVVAVLYNAGPGKAVRTCRMFEDFEVPGIKSWEEREEGSNTMQVMICRIRKNLGKHSIVTVHGLAAYSISQGTWQRCHDVFAEAGLVTP